MIQYSDPTLSNLLSKITQLLDMPEALMEKAQKRYSEVAAWLGAKDSELLEFDPLFYSQGSVRLGTVVRPLLGTDEYDLDAVCRLVIAKERISQKDLKDKVGDRLKNNPAYRAILKPGRRCWRLDFEEKFHMDILPAIPNPDEDDESVLITDRELFRWQFSNPVGLAEWFRRRMERQFRTNAENMAKASGIEVERVPEWKIKTSLQRAVQILKRHRDLRFGDDEDKPISIILTTLAGKAYGGEDEVEAALTGILGRMGDHVKKENGVWVVRNPVHEEENFADKWAEHPQRADKFFEWLGQARQDFAQASRSYAGIHNVGSALGNSLGKEIVAKAVSYLGDDMLAQRKAGTMKMGVGTGALSSTGLKPVREHSFYGDSTPEEN